MTDEERPVMLSQHEAAIVHYALGSHAFRNGYRNGDEAHDEMIAACESAQDAIVDAWGPMVVLG